MRVIGAATRVRSVPARVQEDRAEHRGDRGVVEIALRIPVRLPGVQEVLNPNGLVRLSPRAVGSGREAVLGDPDGLALQCGQRGQRLELLTRCEDTGRAPGARAAERNLFTVRMDRQRVEVVVQIPVRVGVGDRLQLGQHAVHPRQGVHRDGTVLHRADGTRDDRRRRVLLANHLGGGGEQAGVRLGIDRVGEHRVIRLVPHLVGRHHIAVLPDEAAEEVRELRRIRSARPWTGVVEIRSRRGAVDLRQDAHVELLGRLHDVVDVVPRQLPVGGLRVERTEEVDVEPGHEHPDVRDADVLHVLQLLLNRVVRLAVQVRRRDPDGARSHIDFGDHLILRGRKPGRRGY